MKFTNIIILNHKRRKFTSIIDNKGLTLEAQKLKREIIRLEQKVK